MENYIYRFLDIENNVIYIGKTNDLIQRIEAQHFTKNGHLPAACYLKTNKVEYARLNNSAEASIYEIYYINSLKPEYNISYNNREESEESQIILEEPKWIEYRGSSYESKYGRKKKVIIARLRESRDDDIQDFLNNLPPYIDVSDLVREAVREYIKNNPDLNKQK